MALEDLKTLLLGNVQDGSLEVSKRTIGSVEIASLFSLVNPEGVFVLSSVSFSELGDVFRVEGLGTFWNVHEARITVDFIELDSYLTASVQAIPPKSWTIKDSFPNLPSTDWLDQSLLYELSVSHAEFRLSFSVPETVPLLSLSVNTNKHDFPDPLNKWLGAEEINFEGPIDLTADTPFLRLSANLSLLGKPAQIKLSDAQLHVTTPINDDTKTTHLGISAGLMLGTEIGLRVGGTLDFTPGAQLFLEGSFEPVLPLTSLPDLVNAVSSDVAVDVSLLEGLDGLSLRAIQVGIDPIVNHVALLHLQIGKSEGDWRVGPEQSPYFVVEEMSIGLRFEWPLDADRRRVSIGIEGQSQFLGQMFEVSASLPVLIVRATIRDESVQLMQLLTEIPFLKSQLSFDVLPGIDASIKDLVITWNADAGIFYFEGVCDQNLSLPLPGGSKAVEIESPRLTLRAHVQDASAAMLSIGGDVRIAGAKGRVISVFGVSNQQFSIEVSNVELSKVIEAQLGIKAVLPDITLEKAFLSYAGSHISLGGQLATNVQIPVGETEMLPTGIWVKAIANGQRVQARLSGDARLGRTHAILDTQLEGGALVLAGEIPELNIGHLVEDVLGIHEGVPEITLDHISFDISSNGTAHFSASDVSFNVQTVAELLGLNLPAGMPRLNLSLFNAQFDEAGALISLSSNDTLPFANDFQASDFAFSILHTEEQGLSVSLGFLISGIATLADGCVLSLEVDVKGDSGGDFVATGTAQLSLFGAAPMLLDASFAGEGAEKMLAFSYSGTPLEIVSVEQVFVLVVNSVRLQLAKIKQTTRFNLQGDCSLGIGPLPLTEVSLFLKNDAGANSLGLKANTDPLLLPALTFPVPTVNQPSVQITLRKLALNYTAKQAGSKKSSLSLFAEATLLLKHFTPVDTVIGHTFQGQLSASSDGVKINCEIPDGLKNKKWPDLSVRISDKKKIKLPTPSIKAQEIGLEINKGTPQFTSLWRVSVPQKLNEWIGFDAFSPQFDVQLDVGKAFTLWPTGNPNWPFQNLETTEIDGKEWLTIGELQVAIPRFELKGTTWIVKDLALSGLRNVGIPLGALKQILTRLLKESKAAKAVVENLPDAIPLGGINLDAGSLDQQVPSILGPAAVKQINKLLKPTGETLKSILQAISGKVKKLPLHLQEYLKTDVPNEGSLDVGITTSGGATVALRVDPEHPLRVILPYFGIPPGLMGVTVQELKLGTCAGGLLLMQGFDGYIDQFDFITLLAALSNKKEGKSYAHRFTLNKVLAVAPTALPIPIPLLFRELALDHVDWIGFELHSHWSFGPEEELSIVEAFELIAAMVPFFTKKDHFLHTEGHWPDALALPFRIGTNTIGIPAFLGGGEPVGLKNALPPYDMSKSIAYLLDSVKDVNPAFAIQAIPLMIEDEEGRRSWIRVNKMEANISFGPIELGANAAWCIASEEEFKGPIQQYAVQDGVLTPAALDNVFDSLPKGTTYADRGFLFFIMGGWELKYIAGMQCQFGMAFTKDAGFQTGLRVTTTLADVLAFSFGGTIQVSDTRQYIEGDMQLLLLTDDHPTNLFMVKGEIEVRSRPERLISAEVTLQFGLMSIAGGLTITEDSMTLMGKLDWEDFISNGEASVTFSSGGIVAAFAGTVAALSGKISARLPEKTASMLLDFNPGFMEKVQQAIVDVAKREANATIDDVYQDLTSSLSKMSTYSGTVGDLRKKAVPKICDKIISTIDKKIKEVVNREVDKRTGKLTPKFVKKKIKRKAISSANKKAKPYKDASNALKKAAKKSNAKTAVAAKALIKQGKKKIYGVVPLKGKNLEQLNNLVEMIGKLDDNKKISVSKDAEFHGFKLSDQIFARVRASTAEAIEEAIPKIESLEVLDISLVQLVPDELLAQIKFENTGSIDIKVYPRNAVKTSKSVADALTKL